MGEFELIRRFFSRQSADPTVLLGVGDDCAVLQPPEGQQLVVSIDTLVEGTHFLPDTAPDLIARRLLGAAVSDLAAMGAQPAWLTLALTLPDADSDWLSAFSESLFEACQQWGLSLVGGDTTRGHLTLSAQVHGFVPAGKALLRRGARPGDLILVSGTLGDSRAGLETLLKQRPLDVDVMELQQRFYAPAPRLALGKSLRGFATSCIDISDGLLADLGHILQASQCGAEIDCDRLPLSASLKNCFDAEPCRNWALTGGEDFELCFTLPESILSQLPAVLDITPVGRITAEPGIRLFEQGEPLDVNLTGYDHFSVAKDSS